LEIKALKFGKIFCREEKINVNRSRLAIATEPWTILVLEVNVDDMILPMATVKAKSYAVNFANDRSPTILVTEIITMKIKRLPATVSQSGSLIS
jgi:hypothetical protein